MDSSTLLVVYPGFAELQVAATLDLLRGHSALTVATAELAPVRSEGGLRVQPDAAWRALVDRHFDLLLIPGAVDIEFPFSNADLRALLRAAAPRARLIGAICGGPMILAGAGVLGAHRYTTNFAPERRSFLGAPETGFVDTDLVRDGKLLTARGHTYGRFALAIAKAMNIDTTALAHYVLQGIANDGDAAPTAVPLVRNPASIA